MKPETSYLTRTSTPPVQFLFAGDADLRNVNTKNIQPSLWFPGGDDPVSG